MGAAAKYLRAFIAATGITGTRELSEALGVTMRTIQRHKIEIASATDATTVVVCDSATQATRATTVVATETTTVVAGTELAWGGAGTGLAWGAAGANIPKNISKNS